MAGYFDEPDHLDDGAFVTIRYNEILPEDHPARFIKEFVSNIDISQFQKRYKVGEGKSGRPPKGIKMMLGVILYAIYQRIYSAHQIDKATHTYADFWFFTHGKRISHDTISEFINVHADDMLAPFIETIGIAEKNDLLSFEGLYMDGFLIKANASKHKNHTLHTIKKKEQHLEEVLKNILQKLQDANDPLKLSQQKEEVENKLNKISNLKEELNKKISKRLDGKRPDKINDNEKDIRINATDKDSSLMKMKDSSYANAYLKVNAMDDKADIIIGSVVEGHQDEPHAAVKLFKEANQNCKTCNTRYNKVCFDSGFNTLGNCTAFTAMNVDVIAPTRKHENETRNPDKYRNKINFQYDSKNHCVICSEGNILTEKSRHADATKGTVFYKFWNAKVCRNCNRKEDCTKNKQGYFQARVDARHPVQQKVLERYLSEDGQKMYRKRSHVAETYQGDLKKNGKFDQFYKRGHKKVKVESILHDTVWNLRRIFNTKGMEIIWS